MMSFEKQETGTKAEVLSVVLLLLLLYVLTYLYLVLYVLLYLYLELCFYTTLPEWG